MKKPVKKKQTRKPKGPTKQELLAVSLEILSRYFPEQSGKNTEVVRAALGVGDFPSNQQWKKAACDWLASNLTIKK